MNISGPKSATWGERAAVACSMINVVNAGLLLYGTHDSSVDERTKDLWRLAAFGAAGLSGQIVGLFGKGLGSERFVQIFKKFTPFCQRATVRAAIVSLITGTATQVALSKLMGHELDLETTAKVSIAAAAYGTIAGYSAARELELQRALENEARLPNPTAEILAAHNA